MVNIKTQVVNFSDLKYTREAYYRQLDKILQKHHHINIESTSAIFKKNHHLDYPRKSQNIFTDTHKATDKNNKDKLLFLISYAQRSRNCLLKGLVPHKRHSDNIWCEAYLLGRISTVTGLTAQLDTAGNLRSVSI